jgi:hypothetical protein
MEPLNINFVNNGCIPVLFLEDRSTGSARLRVISPGVSFWNNKIPLDIAPLPAPVAINRECLGFERLIWNNAPLPFSTANVPGCMALDADGYLYAPSVWGTQFVVHPPENSGQMPKVWGAHWEHHVFPTAAAVDAARDKVYIPDYPSNTGFGLTGDRGDIAIWEKTDQGCIARFRAK